MPITVSIVPGTGTTDKPLDELEKMGWCKRDQFGSWEVTPEGKKAFLSIRRKAERERARESMIPRARN
jgi:predicted 3-demethylubiquinone-9 3-methyltransferase (glyoxalase superfamily)